MKNAGSNPHTAGVEAKRFRAILARAGKSVLLIFGIFTLSVSTAAFAASNVQGSINGEVTDPNGRVVSGATVTITNMGTGFSRSERTDNDGDFSLTSLPVGSYSVTVEASGYPAKTRENVAVNVGTGTSLFIAVGGGTTELSAVKVTGQIISPIDIRSTESATILGEQTIDRVPVGRNLTQVALLAPGTTRGDGDFGNLASFGGSTVGENVCYINGLNVTDFNNGLGCSTVPFEFYQEFQIKTGGYSAEFGRSTGGVTNAVTKSGTNQFEYGFNVYYTPWIDGISGTSPNVYYQDGNIFIDNEDDEDTRLEANLWASGPIVEDKAFFFLLYNPRDISSTNQTRGEGTINIQDQEMYGIVSDSDESDAFWGLKLDWSLSSNHVLELTAFSDNNEEERNYYEIDNSDLSRVDYNSTLFIENGGTNWAARYTGYLTPDFTLSAMYGENERNSVTNTNDNTVPAVLDYGNYSSSGDIVRVGSVAAGSIQDITSTRRAIRLDAEWFIGDHALRFGVDNETNTSDQNTTYTGTEGFNVLTGQPFPERAGAVYRVRSSYYSIRTYHNPLTSFETKTDALYIEDKWQATNNLVLSLGLRNESFTNNNADGEAFIDISSQIAPRLGAAWDTFGDGTLKVFANYGRYYLPVATNTNVRLAGSEYYVRSHYGIQDNLWQNPYSDGTGPDGVPDYDSNGVPFPGVPNCEPCVVYAPGTIKPTSQSVDQEIEPMYQDEFILGFMKELDSGWSIGTRVIRRDLSSTIEDIAIDAALNQYAEANGHDLFEAGGFDYYVLTNPGSEVTLDVNLSTDINGDGIVNHLDQDFSVVTPTRVTIDSKAAGFPASERYYNAVELLFERAWDGVWFLQGSYTWSQSYGNNEGFVRSDNAQTDAGLTTLFDQPGLLDGAYGYLPNDRRHAFKMFGAYQLSGHWQIGANLLLESGRPINAFGNHGSDAFAYQYGAESFYQDGVLVPRGTRGRTPFRSQVDVSIKYIAAIGASEMTLGLDVFNLFNSQVYTEVDEVAEFNFSCGFPNVAPGQGVSGCVPNPSYGLATSFQPPRSVRFFAQFDF